MARKNKKKGNDSYEQLDLFNTEGYLFESDFEYVGREKSSDVFMVIEETRSSESLDYRTRERMLEDERQILVGNQERKSEGNQQLSRNETISRMVGQNGRNEIDGVVENTASNEYESSTKHKYNVTLENDENLENLSTIHFDVFNNSNEIFNDVNIVSFTNEFTTINKSGLEISIPYNDATIYQINSSFLYDITDDIISHINKRFGSLFGSDEEFLKILNKSSYDDLVSQMINLSNNEANYIYLGNAPIVEYFVNPEDIIVNVYGFAYDANFKIKNANLVSAFSIDKYDVVHGYTKHLSSLDYSSELESDESEKIIHSTPVVENYILKDSDEGKLTALQKFNNNLDAIKTLKLVQERGYATEEEQSILAKYSGWGGLPQVFDENNRQWASRRASLQSIVTEIEYESFKNSTLSAFYTPYIVIDSIYKAIDRIGFEKGTILDPSTGTGNFIGRMPNEMRLQSNVVGIELDYISAEIAKYLYPKTTIEHSGYEKVTIENNTFDLAITNVPFGNYSVYDRDYAKENYKIHDYFFAKTIDKIRPGGILAFITSQSTMDNQNSVIRDELSKKSEFIGAIRLPNNTFKLNGANTEVSSDIIFLKKRSEPLLDVYDVDYNTSVWLESSYKMNDQDEMVRYNQYFEYNPEMVVGRLEMAYDQYGKPCIKTILDNPEEFSSKLATAINSLPENIYEELSLNIEMDTEIIEQESFVVPADLNIKNHAYFIHENKVAQRFDSRAIYIDVNDINYDRIYKLVELESIINSLFVLQLDSTKDEEFEQELVNLNNKYDNFVEKYGYITSRTNNKVMKNDPNYYMLAALENVDRENKTVSKATIFYEKTLKPVVYRKPENLTEAIAMSFNERGRVDIEFVASSLERDYLDVEEELLDKQYVYRIPNSEEVEEASVYLSGNIRKKLEEAKQANIDGSLDSNVKALSSVMPKEIDISDIKCQLGSIFIDEKYVEQFIKEFFDVNPQSWYYDRIKVHLNRITGEWDFDYDQSIASWNKKISETWGVPETKVPYHISQNEVTGFDLIDCILNSKMPVCYDSWTEYENGMERRRRKVNFERTSVARSKYNELCSEFEDWLLKSQERRTVIQEKYNELFNSNVNREYNGSFLTFPGMARDIQMEEYQKNAIARMIYGGNTLLAQVVGAGKTFEMVAAGMEMKRLGISKKPMYVVPNHLVEQWASDFNRLYPQANVLAITTNDFKKENRKAFINRIATNNYDAVIIAHSSFGLIPMSPEYERKMVQNELDNLIDILHSMSSRENRVTVKNLERMKKNLEAKLEKLNDKNIDDGVPLFEMLGVDQIYVDEAHEFKNLYYTTKMTNIAGIQNNGSKKAWDMYLKCQYLREQGNHIVMATGTPISNSIGELYTFQRYLQYEELEERDIHAFDLWAKVFGQVINSFEISVDGSSFKNKLRFNKFFNVPELMTIFRGVAEIQTKSMLKKEMESSVIQRDNSKAPGYIGGKPQVIAIEPSEELENYISEIVKRTEAIHNGGVDPRIDNMLKITTDSKKASIDLRLIDEDIVEISNGKLFEVANKIHEIYEEYNDDKATQLVFCDSSTPKEGFNVYDDIKQKLISFGVPENEIAFIHDAKTDLQKEALFKKVRSGKVRVLIGSTFKMGAGTNVQDRLIAIHHIDVPWRASDIEQRNGRGFRQGNMYDNIYEFRYATRKSFDSFSWQIIENKSTYMQQLLEGTSDSRTYEDDSAMTLSYGEIKAIASGNPLIKEKFEIDQKVKELELAKAAYKKNLYKAETGLISIPNKINEWKNKLSIMRCAVEYADKLPKFEDEGYQFGIQIDGMTFDNYKEAGEKLLEVNKTIYLGKKKTVGNYQGFDIILAREYGEMCSITLKADKYEMKLNDPLHKIGRVNFERIHKMIKHVIAVDKRLNEDINQAYRNIEEYQAVINTPFKQEQELKDVLARQAELNLLLDLEKNKELDVVESFDEEINHEETVNQCEIHNKQGCSTYTKYESYDPSKELLAPKTLEGLDSRIGNAFIRSISNNKEIIYPTCNKKIDTFEK